MNKVESKELKIRQSLSLSDKIRYSLIKIKEWYEEYNGQIAVSYSGGIDSTVLLFLVRTLYSDVPALFLNTGLEFPEIIKFVRNTTNVVWVKSKYTFREVLDKYGYPVPSKEVAQQIYEIRNTNSEKLLHKRLHGANNEYKSGKLPNKWKYLIDAPFKISGRCCYVMKKAPSILYEKISNNKIMIGDLASDSLFRRQSYLRHGCNAFDSKRPISQPIAFWTKQDIWDFIKKEKLPYSTIYNKGYYSTGCTFCMFGIMRDKNRFKLMKQTHPKLHNYCINKLNLKEVLDYIDIRY